MHYEILEPWNPDFHSILRKKEAWLLEDELMTSLDITPHILSI